MSSPGIHLLIWGQKPLPTGFTENQKKPVSFWYKIQFLKFGKREQKTEQFFWFVGFYSKFKSWMKNGKPIVFFVYCSVLPVYRSIFWFLVFQNLNFLNCNRPVFGEPKKPNQASFTDFHENQAGFIDISIHGLPRDSASHHLVLFLHLTLSLVPPINNIDTSYLSSSRRSWSHTSTSSPPITGKGGEEIQTNARPQTVFELICQLGAWTSSVWRSLHATASARQVANRYRENCRVQEVDDQS
jgi:hypothetical protein